MNYEWWGRRRVLFFFPEKMVIRARTSRLFNIPDIVCEPPARMFAAISSRSAAATTLEMWCGLSVLAHVVRGGVKQ